MSRNIFFVIAAIAGILFFTGDKEPSEEIPVAAEDKKQALSGLNKAYQQQLQHGVLSASNAAECGYSSDVGYSYTKPEDAAKKLVDRMNAAIAPLPGEPKPPGPAIKYVHGKKATQKWQIAIHRNQQTSKLVISGFGSDLTAPVLSKEVHCSE